MSINVDLAAEVARRHGLALMDAQALAVLSDDEAHAERLAGQFGTSGDGGKPSMGDAIKARYDTLDARSAEAREQLNADLRTAGKGRPDPEGQQ